MTSHSCVQHPAEKTRCAARFDTQLLLVELAHLIDQLWLQVLRQRDEALLSQSCHDFDARQSGSFLHFYALLPANNADALLLRRCAESR